MAIWIVQSVAGVALASMLGTGLFMGAAIPDETNARAQALLARQVKVDRAVQEALNRPHRLEQSNEGFWTRLADDAGQWGLRVPAQEDFEAPRKFHRIVQRTKTLRPGRGMRSGPLSVKVGVEKVAYMRGGAKLNAKHTVLTLQNVGRKPIAYHLVVRAQGRGACRIRGTRRHNAIALAAGDSAEITVCAGSVSVEIAELEILELDPIGFQYVSRLPPQALAMDPARAAAHEVPGSAATCGQVPASRLSESIHRGELAWDDVVDFYSRHSCERFQMPANYRRATERLSQLPVRGG